MFSNIVIEKRRFSLFATDNEEKTQYLPVLESRN